MSSTLVRVLFLAVLAVSLAAGAASLNPEAQRPLSGDDYGESGDVDDHEESAVPLWMAGFRATNNIEANDTWLALRSQMNLQWDEPITNVVWLGSHNAFNSLGGIFPFENDGVATVLGTSPNQSVSAVGQLNLGARLIELDLWAGGDGTDLFLRHGGFDLTDDIDIDFDSALQGMSEWLAEPENANEILFLDFEDRVEQQDIKPGETGARSTLLAAMDSWFGEAVYTPADRLADGAWPSRRELIEAGKRVIVFTHRNDADGSVFGTHTASSEGWWYADLAFLADGSSLDGLGNFEQVGLGDLRGETIEPEDFSLFSAMQSDGVDITGAPAAKTLDMIYAASRNLNFAKVDFIFGYQNDVDNEYDTPDEDDPLQEKGPYDQHPHRGNRLRGLVWSWAPRDPAIQRQWFQPSIPVALGGDSAASGGALRAFFQGYFSASATGGNDKAQRDLEVALEPLGTDLGASDWDMLIDHMADRGDRARNNGRDYALQEPYGTNWRSAAGDSGAYPYALRSTTRDPETGRYRWKISSETGTWEEWRNVNLDAYTDDGMTYSFAAPVNGFQNGSFDSRMLDEDVFDQENVALDLLVPYADLATRPAHSLWEARIEESFRAFYASDGNFVNAFFFSLSTTTTPVWINVQDTDQDGHWVANAAPNAAPIANDDVWSTDEDTALVIAAPGVLANDTDPDGDPLTAIMVSNPAHGTLALAGDGSFSYTPDLNFFGADDFQYRVNDGEADSGVATVNLTVDPVNDPPLANADAYALDEDTTLNVAAPGVLANDTDVEGPLLAVPVAGPGHGALQLNADGSFSYTPTADYFGIDTFTYRAGDGEAESEPVTVTLEVLNVNDAPVAAADAWVTDEDTPLVVAAPGVLANDADVDGDPLSAVLVAAPAAGSLSWGGDGSFIYTPDPDVFGVDSFTYRAYDGTLGSNVVAVTLTVNAVNDAPVANDDEFTTNEDTALVVAAPGVLTNDSDVENDPLTAAVSNGPSHGTLVLALDGGLSYVPDPDFSGTDSFTYRASDGDLASPPATVTVRVVSAEEQLAVLLEAVEALGDDGLLNRGRVNSLEAKLTRALASLARNNTRAAGNQLNAFINAVEAAVASGQLPEPDGNALIELAEAALVSIRAGV